MVSFSLGQTIVQDRQSHHAHTGVSGFLRHFARPLIFSFLGWMLCFSYLVYDYTIYHSVLLDHIFSPAYLYEMIFHVMMIAFSPALFMFIGYQDYRKTKYMTELEEMTEKWKKTYDSIPDLVFVLDNDHRIIDANKATIERWGADIIGKEFCYSHLCDTYAQDDCACVHRASVISNSTVRQELGGRCVYDVTCSPIFGRNSRIIGSVNIVKDITEKRKAEEEKHLLEAQLIQSQKMESLGRFAGGIAHDFNNLITVILGNCEIMQQGMKGAAPYMKNLEQISASAERAADLAAQILTFSRQKMQDPGPVHLNRLLANFEGLIKRIIGRDIEVVIVRCPDDLVIHGDSGRIEQVLMNLAANARDAMPGGGTLTIALQSIVVGQDYGDAFLGLPEGRYVLLAISDTGSGMSEETRGKIFEPFFSTKERGKGTGLGLAIVYGIIQQHKGHIDVRSAPHAGTTFRIYLPIISDAK